MSNITITTGQFLPMASLKTGKITASAEKVALTLNSMSAAALLGAAVEGKGAIGTQAREALRGQAVTLGQLLAADQLDGGQWGDLFGLLRAEFGVADYNRATMRGRSGCVAYVAAVRRSMVTRFDRAETVKSQDNAHAALQRFDAVEANVMRLNAVAEQAAQAARLLETEQATPDAAE